MNLLDIPTELLEHILSYNILPYCSRVCKELNQIEHSLYENRCNMISVEEGSFLDYMEDEDTSRLLFLLHITDKESFTSSDNFCIIEHISKHRTHLLSQVCVDMTLEDEDIVELSGNPNGGMIMKIISMLTSPEHVFTCLVRRCCYEEACHIIDTFSLSIDIVRGVVDEVLSQGDNDLIIDNMTMEEITYLLSIMEEGHLLLELANKYRNEALVYVKKGELHPMPKYRFQEEDIDTLVRMKHMTVSFLSMLIEDIDELDESIITSCVENKRKDILKDYISYYRIGKKRVHEIMNN